MVLSCYNTVVTRAASASRLGLKLPFSGETSNSVEVSEAVLAFHLKKEIHEYTLQFKVPKASDKYSLAAVLINREPAPVETYNDLDEVATFFRVLQEEKVVAFAKQNSPSQRDVLLC